MTRSLLLFALLGAGCARTTVGSERVDEDDIPTDEELVRRVPSVFITSPVAGATVSGTIALAGTAVSDNGAIVGVAFSVDGNAFADATGTSSWSGVFDTTTTTGTVHTLRARATDATGAIGYSSLVAVNVQNGMSSPGGGSTTTPATVGYTAYVDPELGRALTRDDLVPAGSNFPSGDHTLTRCLITSPITVSTANLTLEGCLIEIADASTSTNVITNFNGNVSLRYVTIASDDGTVMATTYSRFNGDAPFFDHCDIGDVATGVEDNQDQTVVQNSRIIATTNGIAFSGDASGGVYANNRIEMADAGAAIRFSGAPTNVQVSDNFLLGGTRHMIVNDGTDVTRVRVLRNAMDGHTTPTSYTALRWQGREITNTPAEQTTSPNSILWPIVGADVNRWRDTAPLVPNRDGEVIDP